MICCRVDGFLIKYDLQYLDYVFLVGSVYDAIPTLAHTFAGWDMLYITAVAEQAIQKNTGSRLSRL